AALRLGDWHPLHPVHATLVLQPRPRARTAAASLDRHGRVLDAAKAGLRGVDDLGLPAVPLGVPQVHPEQVGGEKRGLLAALTRLYLEDGVPVVVGVLGYEQHTQPVLELSAAAGQFLRLRRERGILWREFPRGGL